MPDIRTAKFERLWNEAREQCTLGSQVDFYKVNLPDPDGEMAFYKFDREHRRFLAHPSQVIARIRATDFRLVESTNKLSQYFTEISGLTLSGECRIPLGHFRKMPLDFVPCSYMAEMVDGWAKWMEISKQDGHGNLAPAEFLCITKCRLEDGSRRMNPGIPIEDEKAGIVSGPARKVSGGSESSHQSSDSGYASGLTLNRPRSESVPASSSPPLRSKKEGIAQGVALELVLSQPFFYLGELGRTLGNYIVAVSLHDQSLWLIYNAWDSSYHVNEEQLEDGTGWDDDTYYDSWPAAVELERQKWFRPDYDSHWAQIPSLAAGRTLMIKLAENVQTWHFDDPAGPELRMDAVWRAGDDDDVVPAFVPARLTSDGYAFRPHIDGRYGDSRQQ